MEGKAVYKINGILQHPHLNLKLLPSEVFIQKYGKNIS